MFCALAQSYPLLFFWKMIYACYNKFSMKLKTGIETSVGKWFQSFIKTVKILFWLITLGQAAYLTLTLELTKVTKTDDCAITRAYRAYVARKAYLSEQPLWRTATDWLSPSRWYFRIFSAPFLPLWEIFFPTFHTCLLTCRSGLFILRVIQIGSAYLCSEKVA